jgi:hypothetical protein
MNTLKTKQLDEIISFALKLIPLVSCLSPNLGTIEKLCKIKYTEKIKKEGCARCMDFVPKENASPHLKATYLAVMVIDDMLSDFFGFPVILEEYINPRHPQHSNKEAQVLALRLTFHNVHMFQQYHEAEITGSNLELNTEEYRPFAGWCIETFPQEPIS